MPSDVNEHEVVESKPKKKRRLRKFLKISGISFGLLFFAALVCYLVCLFIVAGEIRENICAWRDDPDNPLNQRINAVPIEYKVDPAITKDLEKFYIGKFEVLLPRGNLANSVFQPFPVSFASDKEQIYVWPCYANYTLTIMCVPEPEKMLGYHEAQRMDCWWRPLLFGSQEPEAVRQYDSDLWYLQAAYEITTWYWDEPMAEKVEEMARIGACAPEDIEDCSTPWSVCKLETRLLIKKMLILNDGRIFRVKSANWDGCFVDTEYSNWAFLDFDGRTYAFSYGDGSKDTKVAPLPDDVKQTILASLKIHNESDAGAIMYAKAREILDRQNIKLQGKLLDGFTLYARSRRSRKTRNTPRRIC